MDEEPGVERRLAAILAADVVGYSRLMGEDEAGTHRALCELRSAVDPLIGAHGGRIVGTAGDSLLADFLSVVEALNCAIEMQQAARASDMTAFLTAETDENGEHRTGILVEFDRTETIFTRPSDDRTEAYITGRFG